MLLGHSSRRSLVDTSKHVRSCPNLRSAKPRKADLPGAGNLPASCFGIAPGRELDGRILRVHVDGERIGAVKTPVKRSDSRARLSHQILMVIDDILQAATASSALASGFALKLSEILRLPALGSALPNSARAASRIVLEDSCFHVASGR